MRKLVLAICVSTIALACGESGEVALETQSSLVTTPDAGEENLSEKPGSSSSANDQTTISISTTLDTQQLTSSSSTSSSTSAVAPTTTATTVTSSTAGTASPVAGGSGSDSYSISNIPGGKVLSVDYATANLGTSTSRCSVASINANWMTTATKDTASPNHLGIAVVDGVVIQGTDPEYRGVFGERVTSLSSNVTDDWSGKTMVSRTLRKGNSIIENHYAWYTTDTSGFSWAVSGVPLVVDGEYDPNLSTSAQSNYTYGAGNHSFIAVNPNGTLSFGATNSLTARALADLLVAQGNVDVMMLDGGGSTELNIGGQPVVAGTSRKPIWFGMGC